MKILLVIDHFGSGGAQRQMVELACGLRRRGHFVEAFAYFPDRDFFRSRLDAQGIFVHDYRKGRGFSAAVVIALARLVRERQVDVVVSYLTNPNIYAELAKLVTPRVTLVVSERTSYHDDRSRVAALLRRIMHAVADQVVANSKTQYEWLRKKWWLRSKTTCIYNGLEAAAFRVAPAVRQAGEPLRLLAVGRVGPEKNALNLVRALGNFHERFGYVPRVSWVGEPDCGPAGRRYRTQIEAALRTSPEVGRCWSWFGVEADIARIIRDHHALIHPSLYEGLPNVVCEALAAGMPVLVSRVCDHPLLVVDGERGFLFDPNSPPDIADAIHKLAESGPEVWQAFARNSRRYAEDNLRADTMISAYEGLFARLLQRSSIADRARSEKDI